MVLKFRPNEKNNQPSPEKLKLMETLAEDIPNSFGGQYFSHANVGIPHSPMGTPSFIPKTSFISVVRRPQTDSPPVSMPGSDLMRAVYYGADLGGCNAYRMGFPAFYMNYNEKAIINELSSMVIDPRFYNGLSSVTFQRQASDVQKAFLKFIKSGARELGFKIIYEIDDIVFKEDIPDFNACKFAFEDDNVRRSIEEMMQIVDEITVTCNFMKQYYQAKTSNMNVTVIPNYLPKFWFDRFYREEDVYKRFEEKKKKPWVLYAGSATHFDVMNKTGQNDDFSHVVNEIIKARKKFQFVFLGGYPYSLKPFIDNGEMLYYNWTKLLDMPNAMNSIGANITIAPLQDNIFNKAKSNIKLLESGALGLPCVAQNMCTYEMGDLLFNTGNDLIDMLEYVLKDENEYMKYSKKAREYTETMWLENEENWMKRFETTFYRIGDARRVHLLKTNPDQERKVKYNTQ